MHTRNPLIIDARAEARSTSSRDIQSYMTTVHGGDQIFPTNFHPAVPLDDVVWLVNSMEREG
ncbi:unnamed protein product [Porites lobata]|uniref:Uncharacterized protein n=1 Tax=Porites lobata TaxID=104759 RepID=A0ABN8PBK6_9CNID|nr:unnamed protein product [Porites lobata]